jgi:multiple sugar transport system substrate-binding protein
MTITVWDSTEDTKQALFKDTIIPAYEKLHPNITVDYTNYDTGDLQSKVLTALASGQGPTVFELSGQSMPQAIAANLAAPAQDAYFPSGGVSALVNSYEPNMLSAVSRSGKLYALPDQQNAYSLFINTKEFEAAGLDPVKDAPKTWADVARLNKILLKKDASGKVVQKGFDFRYSAGGSQAATPFYMLDYQAGGKVLTTGEKPDFPNAAAIKALETMKAVSSEPTISDNTSANPWQDFSDGLTAMEAGGPNVAAVAESINPAMKGDLAVAPLPQLDPSHPQGLSISFNLGVSSKVSSDAQRVGWDFVNFALKDPQQWFTKTQMLQPKKGWYTTSVAQKTVGISTFVKDLGNSTPSPSTPHYGELQTALADTVQAVILNGKDPEQALKSAAQQYDQAVS